MENSLVSVIVPVYNVERYLNKCVDSIINQTYKNLEIILVNDGSKDNCLSICREYEKVDKRVKVIDKPNGGLSSARNAGLKIATGDFIFFIDSDDFIENNSINILLETQAQTNADITFIGAVAYDTNYQPMDKVVLDNKNINNYSSLDYFKKVCLRQKGTRIWGAIIKKMVIQDCVFKEGRLNEDFLFLGTLCIEKNFTICCCEYGGYGYYQRENSISHSRLGKSIIDALSNGSDLLEKANKSYPELVPYISTNLCYQARTVALLVPYKERKKYKDLLDRCKKLIKENVRNFKKLYGSKKEVVFCKMFIKMPSFTKWLYFKFKG